MRRAATHPESLDETSRGRFPFVDPGTGPREVGVQSLLDEGSHHLAGSRDPRQRPVEHAGVVQVDVVGGGSRGRDGGERLRPPLRAASDPRRRAVRGKADQPVGRTQSVAGVRVEPGEHLEEGELLRTLRGRVRAPGGGAAEVLDEMVGERPRVAVDVLQQHLVLRRREAGRNFSTARPLLHERGGDRRDGAGGVGDLLGVLQAAAA